MSHRIPKLVVLLSLLSFGLLSASVFAKGNPERIIISGPTLDEAIIVEDVEQVRILSIGRVEALGEGAIPEPENLGDEWYELQRQYEANPGQFQTFDSIRYYPNPDGGRGYIYYVGIDGGWSGYDNQWYYVTGAGEATIQRVLSGEGAAYALVLINDTGMLYHIDPLTLVDISFVRIGTEDSIIDRFATTYDGQRALFTTEPADGGTAAAQQVFSPAAAVNCRVSDRHMYVMELPTSGNLLFGSDFGTIQIRNPDTMAVVETFTAPSNFDHTRYFPSPDGMLLYVLGYNHERGIMLTLYDAAQERFVIATNLGNELGGNAFQGTWMVDYPAFYLSDGHTLAEVIYNVWEQIPRLSFTLSSLEFSQVDMGVPLIPAFSYNGRMYLHHALGREQQDGDIDEISGGIYRAFPWGDEAVEHWHPDIPFAQVIMGGDAIYTLSAPYDNDIMMLYRLDPEDGEILATRELDGGRWILSYTRLADDFMAGDSLAAPNCAGLDAAAGNT